MIPKKMLAGSWYYNKLPCRLFIAAAQPSASNLNEPNSLMQLLDLLGDHATASIKYSIFNNHVAL
jgi:hypothetical protein